MLSSFHVMRVFLHHLLWSSDAGGFKKRLNIYLDISSRNKIKRSSYSLTTVGTILLHVGTQPLLKIGVHNSGCVRDPGTMIYTHPDTMNVLESYVKDVLKTFKNNIAQFI